MTPKRGASGVCLFLFKFTFTSRIQEDLTNKRKSFSSRSLFSKYKAMARNVIHVRIHARNFSLNFVLGSQLCYRKLLLRDSGQFCNEHEYFVMILYSSKQLS